MEKKNFMNVGKVFAMLAVCILFSGCGKITKLFESEKKIANHFKVAMSNDIMTKYADNLRIAGLVPANIKITDEDGDNYKLDVTFGYGGEIPPVKATGFYDGDNISWEMSETELQKACALNVHESIRIRLIIGGDIKEEDIEKKVTHVEGYNYKYAITVNGKHQKGKAEISPDGEITFTPEFLARDFLDKK